MESLTCAKYYSRHWVKTVQNLSNGFHNDTGENGGGKCIGTSTCWTTTWASAMPRAVLYGNACCVLWEHSKLQQGRGEWVGLTRVLIELVLMYHRKYFL